MKVNLDNVQLIKGDLSKELLDYYIGTGRDVGTGRDQSLLAVDCEMMGLNPNRDRLCLVQMCDSENRITLVKIENRKIKSSAPNLKALFESEKVKKIFHFGRTDLCFLYHWLDIDLKNVFCTKVASRLVRTFTDKHSLKDLTKEFIGNELDKKNQSSDWGSPELTKDQIRYASYDVIFLIPLYHKLVELLKREERLDIAEEANRFLPTLAKLDIWGYEDFFMH